MFEFAYYGKCANFLFEPVHLFLMILGFSEKNYFSVEGNLFLRAFIY